MKFLDSNIFAYAFYQNPRQEHCQRLIREGGVTDILTLVEAFNIIEAETNRETAMSSVRGLLRSDLEIVAVDLTVFFEALKQAGRYQKLKFLDLVHYTVAKLKQCPTLVSYDSDFDGLDIPREYSENV